MTTRRSERCFSRALIAFSPRSHQALYTLIPDLHRDRLVLLEKRVTQTRRRAPSRSPARRFIVAVRDPIQRDRRYN